LLLQKVRDSGISISAPRCGCGLGGSFFFRRTATKKVGKNIAKLELLLNTAGAGG